VTPARVHLGGRLLVGSCAQAAGAPIVDEGLTVDADGGRWTSAVVLPVRMWRTPRRERLHCKARVDAERAAQAALDEMLVEPRAPLLARVAVGRAQAVLMRQVVRHAAGVRPSRPARVLVNNNVLVRDPAAGIAIERRRASDR
jgi:hypothetical protein